MVYIVRSIDSSLPYCAYMYAYITHSLQYCQQQPVVAAPYFQHEYSTNTAAADPLPETVCPTCKGLTELGLQLCGFCYMLLGLESCICACRCVCCSTVGPCMQYLSTALSGTPCLPAASGGLCMYVTVQASHYCCKATMCNACESKQCLADAAH